MNLYGHPWSSNSRRVQMLCEELKIPYAFETVDLMKGAQYSPEFVRLNPNSKVPVLDDDGFLLWESQAIMRYLADKHKAGAWYPSGLRERAVVEQWLDWNHSRLSPECGKIMYNLHFAGAGRNDQAIEDGRKWLLKILPVMESALLQHPYLCGADITLADRAVATNIAHLEFCRYDFGPYPAIRRWCDAIKARPCFAATTPRQQA